ncbi:hypothetical protein KA078_00995 [Candidatus Woesebacteria bacterium]|nr:hypothetical protein [Candidatus Woesebacteria bacterium]
MHSLSKLIFILALIFASLFGFKVYSDLTQERSGFIYLVTLTDGSPLICWDNLQCGWLNTPTIQQLAKYPQDPSAVPTVVSKQISPNDIVSKEKLFAYDAATAESFSPVKGGVIGKNTIVLSLLHKEGTYNRSSVVVFDRTNKKETELLSTTDSLAYPISLNAAETHALILHRASKSQQYEIMKIDGTNQSGKMAVSDFQWTSEGYLAKPAYKCETTDTLAAYACPLHTSIINCRENVSEQKFATVLEGLNKQVVVGDWYAVVAPQDFVYSPGSVQTDYFTSIDGFYDIQGEGTSCVDAVNEKEQFPDDGFKLIAVDKKIVSKSGESYTLNLAVRKYDPSTRQNKIAEAEISKGNRKATFSLVMQIDQMTSESETQQVQQARLDAFKTMVESALIKY